jgi:hypothetical protein
MQIQLSEAQHRQVRRVAQQRGVSFSAAIRAWVQEGLSRLEAPTRETRLREALAVCGKYVDRTGARTVARDHDRYLAEAFRP